MKFFDISSVIRIDEATHKYYRGASNIEYQGVSSFLGQFKAPFDEDYWAGKKAKERGVTKEKIKKEWKDKRDKSILKGKLFHSMMEYYFKTPKVDCIYQGNLLQQHDHIISQIDDIITFSKAKYGYNSIYTECILYSDKLKIAGTADLILCNHATKKCMILDYKTNETLAGEAYNNFKAPLKDMPETKINYYALQLNMYSMLLWHCLGYKVDEMMILHLEESNTISPIEVVKMSDSLKALYNFRQNQLIGMEHLLL